VGVLGPVPRLAAALADLGIDACGELAALTREAVETRLGPEAAALWRLARGDDPRRVFAARPSPLPAASVSWEEYALRDPERLVFPANALLGSVCAALRERGEAARQMTLAVTLADGAVVARALRSARATADRAVWLRLVRQELERFTLPDGVVGLALRAEAAGAAEAPQGDLFDRGFQSGEAAEAALARLLDDGDAELVGLATTAHPLLERRTQWVPRAVADLRVRGGAGAEGGAGAGGGGVDEPASGEWRGLARARGAPPHVHDGAVAGDLRHRFAAGRGGRTPSALGVERPAAGAGGRRGTGRGTGRGVSHAAAAPGAARGDRHHGGAARAARAGPLRGPRRGGSAPRRRPARRRGPRPGDGGGARRGRRTRGSTSSASRARARSCCSSATCAPPRPRARAAAPGTCTGGGTEWRRAGRGTGPSRRSRSSARTRRSRSATAPSRPSGSSSARRRSATAAWVSPTRPTSGPRCGS
jgi:hypothetical protein